MSQQPASVLLPSAVIEDALELQHPVCIERVLWVDARSTELSYWGVETEEAWARVRARILNMRDYLWKLHLGANAPQLEDLQQHQERNARACEPSAADGAEPLRVGVLMRESRGLEGMVEGLRQIPGLEVVVLRPGSEPGGVREMMHNMWSVDALVGIHGAGFTNMIFRRPGAAVVQVASPLMCTWGGHVRSFAVAASLTDGPYTHFCADIGSTEFVSLLANATVPQLVALVDQSRYSPSVTFPGVPSTLPSTIHVKTTGAVRMSSLEASTVARWLRASVCHRPKAVVDRAAPSVDTCWERPMRVLVVQPQPAGDASLPPPSPILLPQDIGEALTRAATVRVAAPTTTAAAAAAGDPSTAESFDVVVTSVLSPQELATGWVPSEASVLVHVLSPLHCVGDSSLPMEELAEEEGLRYVPFCLSAGAARLGHAAPRGQEVDLLREDPERLARMVHRSRARRREQQEEPEEHEEPLQVTAVQLTDWEGRWIMSLAKLALCHPTTLVRGR